jgi:hypothetical protein
MLNAKLYHIIIHWDNKKRDMNRPGFSGDPLG